MTAILVDSNEDTDTLDTMASPQTDFPRAGFLRRLAAMLYDTLVAIAVGMCAAMLLIVVLVVLLQNGILSMHGAPHPADYIEQSWSIRLMIQLWVAFWVVLFFAWFWRNGGQTLGMRAWRLRLFSTNGQPITYRRALLRMMYSVLGLGTILVLFDRRNHQSLQDRLADTEILSLSKNANHHRSWRSLN